MEDNHIKFKTTMSSLCDHSAVHILIKRKMLDREQTQQQYKQTDIINKYDLKILQDDNAKDLDVVIFMYNLIKYRDNRNNRSFIAIL